MHLTDFSLASEMAFAHALKLGVAGKMELRIVHYAEQDVEVAWECFPKVQETLARWKVIAPESSQEEMHALGIRVEGIIAKGEDLFSSIFRQLDQHAADLLILATHQIDGLNRWLYTPVAEPLARRAGLPTLFVPPVADGCVSVEDGSVLLRRILIPIDHLPQPQPAIDHAVHLAQLLAPPRLTWKLLHVGKDHDLPRVDLPRHEGWVWETFADSGSPLTGILEQAEDFSPQLLVMVTKGHQGLLDMLRGSITERVLREVRCPVLAIPDH